MKGEGMITNEMIVARGLIDRGAYERALRRLHREFWRQFKGACFGGSENEVVISIPEIHADLIYEGVRTIRITAFTRTDFTCGMIREMLKNPVFLKQAVKHGYVSA